ncbi:hypothetical protein CYMTET_5358 [Cymbomonas tetramitiformis]|uniref:Bidirectional sugar transporter SWEET n=1 Tax=Cymbomonas tetramitiformis TaxID=36881 RepID=A0AAE0GZJ1_9CHLO|nr:hypothetical protein CYMTET_5358 [Cymbomonas tetramitiformis]
MPSFAGITWVCDPVIQNTIGWAAVFAVLGLFASPIKDIWGEGGVFKRKDTGNLASGLVYFSSFFNCFFWVIYALGDLPRLLQPLVINVIGASLQLSFLSCYWYYAENKKECNIAFLGGATVALASAIVAYNQSSVTIFGTAAAVLNVIMYYSPLAAVGTIIKEKSVAKMPFLPLLMTLIGSSLWFSYGAYIFDWPCIIPNILGVMFGITQLGLYTYFSRAYPEDKLEAAKSPPEGDSTGGAISPTAALQSSPRKPYSSVSRRSVASVVRRQTRLVQPERAAAPLIKAIQKQNKGRTQLHKTAGAKSPVKGMVHAFKCSTAAVF